VRVNYTAIGLAGVFVAVQPLLAQQTTDVIQVVGQTPLGADIDADRIAANAQTVSGAAIAAQRPLDLAEFMQRNLGSVYINEAQSNPLQPDLQYRGFTGSPLLGLSQGLAVYQDGVRLNEPFGDTVNWALLPESAIDSMALIPGSNPLFGLNALGGAISIHTKDGFNQSGTSAQVSAGSFGRVSLQASTGQATETFGYFVTGEWLEEDGWRDFSPTGATQVFGKLGWRFDRTEIDLSLAIADTELIGNGPLPAQLLALDREAIFTRPDITDNEMALANVVLRHRMSDRWTLTGNLYLRSSDIHTLNGDDSEIEACEADPSLLCQEDDGDEVLVLDTDGNQIAANPALEGAAVNLTNTFQDGSGFSLQSEWQATLFDRENRLVVGTAHDDGSIAFAASSELGSLDATRLAVPGGVFVGDAETRLDADTSNLAFYFVDTLALAEEIDLTLSARYNDTVIILRDRLGTELNGQHHFDRLNVALGLTAGLLNGVNLYAGFSQSSRAPSPVELTCADPDDPCRLPNAFLSDPPLEDIVAHTIETGLRGQTGPADWHLGLFRTTSRDDILFISAGALTGQGFFSNIGRTRRDGIEFGLNVSHERIQWHANYTFLDATFRQRLIFPGPNNPAAVDGEVSVQTGDQLPLVPRHLFKAGAQSSFGERFTFGANVHANSSFHLRGDEGNNIAEVGRALVFNLRGDYRISDRLSLFLTVDNVFDHEYETFGLFGEPDEVLGDEFDDPRFLSPAPPRAAWFGVEIRLAQ
jgi:iron complex outermembrane receptor protein